VDEQRSQSHSGVGDTVLGGDDRENKVSAAKPTKGQTSGRAQTSAGRPGPVELRHLTLHGHRVAYLQAGSGPVVVLIHGITSTSATWKRVMPYLSRRFTVIAPDLIGHGQSAKPRGDYSLGAYASGLRDLLAAIGHERATFVGHSLGGGVAMQLSYQFPELCERLVLVDSGGLGREVSLFLRAATLPGSEAVLGVLRGVVGSVNLALLLGILGYVVFRVESNGVGHVYTFVYTLGGAGRPRQ
jgi:pimeloyl-ACP methyl ester carboxylesterase